MCLCRCVPAYKHVCPPMCVHVCKWVHTRLYDTRDRAHTCLCLHTHVYASAHTHTCAGLCTCMHTCIHSCVHVCSPCACAFVRVCVGTCAIFVHVCACTLPVCVCRIKQAQWLGTIRWHHFYSLQCSNGRFYRKFLCLWLFPSPFSAAGSAVHPPSLHSPGSFVRTTLNISTVTHWSVTGFGHFF